MGNSRDVSSLPTASLYLNVTVNNPGVWFVLPTRRCVLWTAYCGWWTFRWSACESWDVVELGILPYFRLKTCLLKPLSGHDCCFLYICPPLNRNCRLHSFLLFPELPQRNSINDSWLLILYNGWIVFSFTLSMARKVLLTQDSVFACPVGDEIIFHIWIWWLRWILIWFWVCLWRHPFMKKFNFKF